jgi:hypothetical protein
MLMPRSYDEEDYEFQRPDDAKTSGKAIAGLILGALSFVLLLFTGIPAIIFAALGMRDIGRSKGRLTGQGLAIAGLVTGILGTLLTCAALPLLLIPAVQKVREAANRIKNANNLKLIGLAMHNHLSAFDRFPPPYMMDKSGKPGLSWRVAILPFIGEDSLYKQFHLDEP